MSHPSVNLPIVFEVSEVPHTDQALPEVPYYEAIETLLRKPVTQWFDRDQTKLSEPTKRTIEACSRYRGRLVANVLYHPFVAAIYQAFNDHRLLCLSPDMI
jgi:hypothetical protein